MKLPNDLPPVMVKAAMGETLSPSQRDELAGLLRQSRQKQQSANRVRPKQKRKRKGVLCNVFGEEAKAPPAVTQKSTGKPVFALGDDPEFCEVMEQRRFATRDGIDALIAWRVQWEENLNSPPTEGRGQADLLELWNVAGRLMDLYNVERKMR